jgi:hypothetical protein
MHGDHTAEVELHTVLERLANHRVESEIDPITQIDFGDYRGIWFNSVFSHFQLKKKIPKCTAVQGSQRRCSRFIRGANITIRENIQSQGPPARVSSRSVDRQR